MNRQRWLYVFVFLLLLISVSLNVLLYGFGESQYREVHRVRLDPTSERIFAPKNAALLTLDPGVARIVFFGDSRISSWEHLPTVPGTQIVNRGRSGETTAQMLLRLDRDVIALAPDVVVIQAGVNDLKSIGIFPHRAEEIIESCRRNLEKIVERLTEADIRVVVLTILPVGTVPLKRRPVWSEQTRDAIEQVNEQLRSTDYSRKSFVLVDCDSVIAEGRRIKPTYELDTLHVNAFGYEALNALVEPVLTSILQDAGSSG